MNKILQEDIIQFAETFSYSNDFKNKKILITGATGLIGSTLVRCLLAINKDVSITIPVRSQKKTKLIFEEYTSLINIIECDLANYCNTIEESFDYIIHCASPTSGSYINEHPTETFELALETTRSLLQYANRHSIKGMAYISSLEYYGQNFDDHLITEEFQGYVDITNPRSSYPMSKRATEHLCMMYAKEYGVPVKIARLTQTFGSGVSLDDNRVFAQFTRSVVSGEDIVMHTSGESAKPYCYTTDCASAIFTILLKGENGEAYNVANPVTYISIRSMAEFLRDNFNPEIRVIVEEHPEMGYAPITKLRLSTEKLKALGWQPRYDLKEMFKRLIDYIKQENYEDKKII